MKKLIIGSFSLLFASVITAPVVRAQTETMTETGTTNKLPATQIEKLQQQTNGRYHQTDSQVEEQGTGMGDEQPAPTQTEDLQQQTETEEQQTETEGTSSTQEGQQNMPSGIETEPGTGTIPGTGTEGGQQFP